jgi:nicotinamidase-related amidase
MVDKTAEKTPKAYYHELGSSGSSRIIPGKRPAIVNVDLQKAFTLPAERSSGIELGPVIEQTNRIIEAAREKKLPIIFTVVAYRKSGVDCGPWGEKGESLRTIELGSRWAELDDRLNYRKEEDILIVKRMASAFFNTELQPLLTYLGVDTVIVTGDSTSGCVRATVVDALSYGFRPVMPEECVGDREEGPHYANLYDMKKKYAYVASVQEVLQYLKNLLNG